MMAGSVEGLAPLHHPPGVELRLAPPGNERVWQKPTMMQRAIGLGARFQSPGIQTQDRTWQA